jgi:hypothetical protein
VCFDINSTERVKLILDILGKKASQRITEVEGFSDG